MTSFPNLLMVLYSIHLLAGGSTKLVWRHICHNMQSRMDLLSTHVEMERLSIGIVFMLENTIIILNYLWISRFHITVKMQLMQERQFELGMVLVKKWVVVSTLPSRKLRAQYIAAVALMLTMFATLIQELGIVMHVIEIKMLRCAAKLYFCQIMGSMRGKLQVS